MKKGKDWVKRIRAVHHLHSSGPITAGNHFMVAREMDMDVAPLGRIQIHELMLYEVREGKIVSAQFF